MTQLLEVNVGIADSAFGERLEPYRRELHLYCYRMLGAFDAADELVRDVFGTAWQQRDRLESDWWLRARLYRIATTACLDALGPSSRRPATPRPVAATPTGESIDTAFVAALQLLPPRQRAALILRDVLGWSMRETAGLLDTTIVAANSALQRARSAIQEPLPARLE